MTTFLIGDRVHKRHGYVFNGEVRGTFYTKAGLERVVVEQDDSNGLLHIFDPKLVVPKYD